MAAPPTAGGAPAQACAVGIDGPARQAPPPALAQRGAMRMTAVILDQTSRGGDAMAARLVACESILGLV
jgi:hypothetical protein